MRVSIYFITTVLALGFPEICRAQPKPKPAPTPAPKPAAKPAPRAKILATLRTSRVTLAYPKAPLEDVIEGLRRSTGLTIRIGKKAQKVLEKRKWKIKYIVSGRRAQQVLADLVKAAALDYLVSDEGVLIDTKRVIKKLKKKLGLKTKATRLSAKDVRKALTTKELSLSSNKKSLSTFLKFLKHETGIPFVSLTTDAKKQPLISIALTEEPLKNVLDRALHPVGYDWVQQGRVILVGLKDVIAEQKKPKKKAKPKK